MSDTKKALEKEIGGRARTYTLIYEELSAELGPERAAALLKRAIYRRGEEKGKALAARLGKPDLAALAGVLSEGGGADDPFGQEVVAAHEEHVLFRLNSCPLVQAWEEQGLSAEQKQRLCDIAYQVDFGKFEAAGYDLSFDCRIAKGAATCDMHLTKKAPEESKPD
jgi:hypothetical protein